MKMASEKENTALRKMLWACHDFTQIIPTDPVSPARGLIFELARIIANHSFNELSRESERLYGK